MKNTYIYIILLLLLVGLIVLIGFWFNTNFERVSNEVEVGFQGKARNNPLLAAEQLLERMGTPVERLRNLYNFENHLDTQDTLILLHYGSFLKKEQLQQLNQWVDEGGHLIIVSETLHSSYGQSDTPDPLLSELNIYQFENELDETTIENVSPTELFWAQHSMKVAFNPNYFIESTYSDQAIKISDEYGTHLLFYYYGIGMITVLSDLSFIENHKIADYDHAQFLWLLVNFERPAKRVWILSKKPGSAEKKKGDSNNIPDLFTLLWRNMWTVIITATILLLFWLWLASQRFGPLLPLPSRTRRRLLEHLEASGYFLWQQKQVPVLLYSAKQALLKRLQTVHPDWIHLSERELSEQLAPLSTLTAVQIEEALQTRQSETEMDFTETIEILTQLRKSL
jgi:hypothetical protein